MLEIHFRASLSKIGSWTILRLPKSESAKLPSRALTMVKAIINGFPFQTTLEPDGKGSHWFRVGEDILKATHAVAGDTITLEIEPNKEWVEPEVPADLKKALVATPKAYDLGMDITPNALWDWIRWARTVKTPE